MTTLLLLMMSWIAASISGLPMCWMVKKSSFDVNGPSIFRISSMRTPVVALFGLNVAGISVNGTSISPCASAGVAQSGTNASKPAAASPRFKVSLRVVCCGVVSSGMALLGRDEIAGFWYILSLVL
jgi:hypothetical protein